MVVYKLGKKEKICFIPTIIDIGGEPRAMTYILANLDFFNASGFEFIRTSMEIGFERIRLGPWTDLIKYIQPFLIDYIEIYPSIIKYSLDPDNTKRLLLRNLQSFESIENHKLTAILVTAAFVTGGQRFVLGISQDKRLYIKAKFPEMVRFLIRYDATFLGGIPLHYYSELELCEFIRINPYCIGEIPESRITEPMRHVARTAGSPQQPPPQPLQQSPQPQQSPLHIRRLPKHVEDAVIEQAFVTGSPLCPITMEPLTRDTITVTICGHLFSRGALGEALLRSRACPTCRGALK